MEKSFVSFVGIFSVLPEAISKRRFSQFLFIISSVQIFGGRF
jgi:hypothetical protein